MKYNGDNIKTAVALGSFDGLHIAHMQVIKAAAEKKSVDTVACVLLFDEHPQRVINGVTVPKLLQDSKRACILAGIGVEEAVIPFSRIKDYSPEEFADKVLVEKMNAAFVVCGYNYRFGKNGAGDTVLLQKLCAERGIELQICPAVTLEGEPVSSTAIRKLIEKGNVAKAALMLGRRFSYSTEVISGDKRGRLLGTPTVNQALPDDFAVPAFGVYISSVSVDGKEYTGVTDIGSRPTFGGTDIRSETFIIDFGGDLYGKIIEISLCDFIRPEIGFDSADALRVQIAADIDTAKKYFSFQKQ